jgi:predicted enzyme related to lactoylglutathione lyase
VFAEPTDIPYGRFAVARDPQGAFFSFIKLAQTT